MKSPWLIHEAEVALFPAWKDGLPFRGPGLPRSVPTPVFSCKSALSISETRRAAAPDAHSWSGAVPKVESSWDISLTFLDGVFADTVSRVMSRLPWAGLHILVVRFIDEKTGEWSCFQWFYTTVETDESTESSQVMARTLRLNSTWMQESVGSSAPPPLLPAIRGEVDWLCGPLRVTGLHYDPVAETWLSTAANETGDGSRYVNLSPVTGSATDIALSAYLPRVHAGNQAAPALPVAAVVWENQVLLRIGNHASTVHHGLSLSAGWLLQTLGIVEPLLTQPQDRMLDEPVIVFRYLRRIYAVLGHGVLAIPRLVEDEAPPFSHDYPFRLAVPGAVNPVSGQSGLTLLPDGGWLDNVAANILLGADGNPILTADGGYVLL
jgi:hypothetical protein